MYCKAGFHHLNLDDCDHIAPMPKAAVVVSTFELPKDFYSAEATAARKAENKAKYQPGLAGQRIKVIKAVVNQAGEMV